MASTLERLSSQELGEMIAFRWSVASGGGQHPFTDEALVGLFEHSGGMPREATILADNALLLGFYRKQSTIDRQTIDDAAADRNSSLAIGEGRHGGQ